MTGQRVAAFLCPSDPNAGTLSVLRAADGRNDMLDVSYVASAGTTTNSPNNTAPDQRLGDAGEHRVVLVVQELRHPERHRRDVEHRGLLRGAGEQFRGVDRRPLGVGPDVPGELDARGSPAPAGRRSSTTPTRTRRRSSPGCRPARPPGRAHQGYNNCRGIFWEIGSLGMTMFNTIVAPNSTQYNWGDCRYTGGGYPNDATFANVNSIHPGGVNMLMADGSVRFVKSSINQYTWWSLGTRANGEVISSDSY